MSWIAERAAPTTATDAITLEELHADYARWCLAWKYPTLSIDQFEEELDRVRALPDLMGKIRKFGDRYYGVKLVQPRARTLSRRSG